MGTKNKPSIIGQLLIDLTPLLDVIFILLIVVITYVSELGMNESDAMKQEVKDAHKQMQEARQREIDAADRMAEAEAVAETAKEQLIVYKNMYDSVNVVTIYASYTPSDIKNRTVHVQINANEMWEEKINPSNEDDVWEKCKKYIEDELVNDSDKSIPTLFSITNEKMLYRDEQSILSLYEKLNIEDKYLKTYTETEDE